MSTLRSLIQGFKKKMITHEDVKDCLVKSSSTGVVFPETILQPEPTHPAPTIQELDQLDCDDMFSGDTDNEKDNESDETSMLPQEKDNESDEASMLPQEILPAKAPADVAVKRKFCGCDHDNLFGEAYTKLEFRSYFSEAYMKQRDYPVRYCTAIKENGELCNLDFTNLDVVITTSNPVRACQHAMKMDSECVHAICTDCYKYLSKKHISMESGGGGQGRSSRRRHNNAVEEIATRTVPV